MRAINHPENSGSQRAGSFFKHLSVRLINHHDDLRSSQALSGGGGAGWRGGQVCSPAPKSIVLPERAVSRPSGTPRPNPRATAPPPGALAPRARTIDHPPAPLRAWNSSSGPTRLARASLLQGIFADCTLLLGLWPERYALRSVSPSKRPVGRQFPLSLPSKNMVPGPS